MQRYTERNLPRTTQQQPSMWAQLEACWTRSVERKHTLKQAWRTLATAFDPDTTEEEFESLYHRDLKPQSDAMRDYSAWTASLTAEQRAAHFHERLAELGAKPDYAGVQLSDQDKAIAFAMMSTPIDRRFFE